MFRSGTKVMKFLPPGKTIEFGTFEDPVKEYRSERFIPPKDLQQKTTGELVQIYTNWYDFYQKRGRVMDFYPKPSEYIGTSAI